MTWCCVCSRCLFSSGAHFLAGMTDTQLVEYKKLHSKLSYQMKMASTEEDKEVWGTAMKKLKTNRNEMLEKFMQDNKLITWCTQLMHKEQDISSSGSKATTMDLNRYQMKEKLGISHLPDDSEYM